MCKVCIIDTFVSSIILGPCVKCVSPISVAFSTTTKKFLPGIGPWMGPQLPRIFILLIFRGLLVQMAGQWAAASSCQFPNFPDLRVRPSLRQPTGAVGAVEAGNLLHGKLLHWHTAETIALQNTGLQLNTAAMSRCWMRVQFTCT